MNIRKYNYDKIRNVTFHVCLPLVVILVAKDNKPFLEAVKLSPSSVIVGVVCFFSVWSILGLAGFHTYLTSSNQTTNEDVSTFNKIMYQLC